MKKKIKKKRKKLRSLKAIKRECDKIYSIIVRSVGYCQSCGTEEGKNDAHHIYERGRWGTRWDLRNGIRFCFLCHKRGIHSPSFDRQRPVSNKIIEVKGSELLEVLRVKSLQPVKKNRELLESTLVYLKEELLKVEEKNEKINSIGID